MSWQIIRQPNNEYCIFSTIVDHFIAVNLSRDELVDFYIKERGKYSDKRVYNVLEELENGMKPYHQFTMTFDESIQQIKSCHGTFEVKIEDDSILYEKDFN